LTPNATGGHLVGVQKALSLQGVAAEVVYFYRDRFAFGANRDLSGLRGSKIAKFRAALREFLRHEVLHYNDAKSLIPFLLDVVLARLLGKRVVVTFNGTYSRLKIVSWLSQRYSQWGRQRSFPYTLNDATVDAKTWARNVAWLLLAHRVFCLNPDLRRGLPGSRFLPYVKASVVGKEARVRSVHAGQKITIAHAPSYRSLKGTDLFLAAVDRVNARHGNLVVLLLENLPNDQVVTALDKADLLFDQLWAGWYGGVAVEAMSLGLPVLSYLREADLKYLPVSVRHRLPILQVDPDSLEQVLEAVSTGQINVAEASRKSIEYVKSVHSPHTIGLDVLNAYELRSP